MNRRQLGKVYLLIVTALIVGIFMMMVTWFLLDVRPKREGDTRDPALHDVYRKHDGKWTIIRK